MANGMIFMTALLPTSGHLRLVRFAQDFLAADGGGKLFVIISTRTFEPTSFEFRANALRGVGPDSVETLLIEHKDEHAPQNPAGPEDPDFWGYWKNVVVSLCGVVPDIVFASEPYGANVAQSLSASFVPVDIAREIDPSKGTVIRQSLLNSSDKIAPVARKALSTNWVMFGQESVGKTTLARRMAKDMNGTFHHEWARPYLETIGSEVTEERMTAIFRGQSATELAAHRDERSILRFLDTDLMSTIGYYRICGITPHPLIEETARRHQAIMDKRYLLISDVGVPFEQNVLRYGGDRRETDLAFWVDLLEEYGLSFELIDGDGVEERTGQIRNIIMRASPCEGVRSYETLINFVRD